MIYEKVDKYKFTMTMQDHGFSYDGADDLFDYLVSLGVPIELDPTEIKNNFVEYNGEDALHNFKSGVGEVVSFGGDRGDEFLVVRVGQFGENKTSNHNDKCT